MRNAIYAFVLFFLTSSLLAQGPAPNASSNLELLQFTSKVFHNTRTLRVLVPAGYKDKQNAQRRYPVFYLNDGYAVFAYWNAQETVYRLIREHAIPPIILVGIDNAGERERANEYLPYPDDTLDPPLPHPQGSLYPHFLIDEVMPFINQRFRTATGPDNTGLGGASYGSYIAFFTVAHRPGVFGKLLLESTPLYIGDFRIFDDARKAKRLPGRISIEVGSQETPDDEINKKVGENANKLAAAIRESSPNSQTRVIVERGGEHNSESWKRRLPDALKYLFGRP